MGQMSKSGVHCDLVLVIVTFENKIAKVMSV